MSLEIYPLSEADFEQHWMPITRDGDLLEHDDVVGLPIEEVWTVVEGDNGDWFAEPGFRVVNRVGYIRTQRAWTQEEVAAGLNAIWFEAFESESDEPATQVAP